MDPESIQSFIEAAAETRVSETSVLSYLIWAFFAVLVGIIPFAVKLFKFVAQMVSIMDMHISELKYMKEQHEKLEAEHEKLRGEHEETKLQVRENKTKLDMIA